MNVALAHDDNRGAFPKTEYRTLDTENLTPKT
jgi:hypothetical protein